MKIQRTPREERTVIDPEKIYAEGNHIRVNVVGDSINVAFVRAPVGMSGYVFDRSTFPVLVEEMNKIMKELDEG